jgi:hypothetical protein
VNSADHLYVNSLMTERVQASGEVPVEGVVRGQGPRLGAWRPGSPTRGGGGRRPQRGFSASGTCRRRSPESGFVQGIRSSWGRTA